MVKAKYTIPLLELVSGFYDSLKSISQGFASLDYKILDFKKNSGWIHKIMLIKSKSLITTSEKILFKKPSLFSKPIIKIKSGRLLIVKKCIDNWCEINTDVYTGWIKDDNIWGSIK